MERRPIKIRLASKNTLTRVTSRVRGTLNVPNSPEVRHLYLLSLLQYLIRTYFLRMFQSFFLGFFLYLVRYLFEF